MKNVIEIPHARLAAAIKEKQTRVEMVLSRMREIKAACEQPAAAVYILPIAAPDKGGD